MKSAQANQVQFVFLCGSLAVDTFSVVDFSGTDRISNLYQYTITLRSLDANVNAADVLNKPATFFIFRDGEFYPYSGIVSQFSYVDSSTDYSTYSVVLVPHLWLLNLNKQSRVFQKMNVKDIVKKVLDDGNLADYYTFDLQGTYPVREFVVQYKESDFNFICRLLEESGIWFFFKELPILEEELESVGKESLMISDRPDSFIAISGENEIRYKSPSGLFQHDTTSERECCYKISFSKSVVTQNVLVKSYNYRTPEVALTGQKAVEGGASGKNYLFGGNFKDTDSAQKSAALLAKQTAMKVVAIKGNADCRGFRAGMRFTLIEHAREECNDTYLIESVAHIGGHSSTGGGDRRVTYRNNFSLLPSAMISFYAPAREHKATQMHGIITAPIEANGSDYASLDDSGRYKVRLPFDISDNKNYDASKYVRLAQPYSGANYGIHFPSHEGSEMILACIDGDLDKPLGIGTVPNANTKSPVVSTNKEQNIIRTAGKNEIVLDDTDAKQKIRITTAAKNTINLDDENRFILVQTTDGNKLLIDDKNTLTTLTSKNHNLTMSYKDGDENITITSGKGHLIKIDDAAKKLTIQTAAGHIVQLDDDGKKIMMTDCNKENSVTLDGNNGLALDSKGKVTITAAQDLEIKGANISLEATKGKVNVKASTDVATSAMNIESKASVGYKVKGTNVELAADAQMKIKGSATTEVASDGMATVKGGAMLTLKGTMVMIN